VIGQGAINRKPFEKGFPRFQNFLSFYHSPLGMSNKALARLLEQPKVLGRAFLSRPFTLIYGLKNTPVRVFSNPS